MGQFDSPLGLPQGVDDPASARQYPQAHGPELDPEPAIELSQWEHGPQERPYWLAF